MKVIIPVAGIGTRLRPHTHSTPKPLLHVAGRPILAHILEPIVKLSPDEVIFVVGFMGEQIVEWVKKHYTFRATFIQQDKLLGLGYALHLAMANIDNEPLLVVLGDTIADCDLGQFIKIGENVLGLRQVDDPKRFGLAEIQNGIVARLEEKPEHPKSNLAVIGLYYFKSAAPVKKSLSNLVESGKTTRGEIQLTDALQDMIDGGTKFTPFEVKRWYDCGKKETMLETNRYLLQSQAATAPSPNAYSGSLIKPPVYIAANASIIDSILGPFTSVSAGTTIKNSTVANSIVGEDVTIESMHIIDSLVGHRSKLIGLMDRVSVFNIGEDTSIACDKSRP
ncbi:MAG: sugar phosphate nucleotidyltransferase [candidate division Zixibacteria bacterium]|nr:sugar phosphate nucleotidyltransferase [candidate division Zixibacteria bacterium]